VASLSVLGATKSLLRVFSLQALLLRFERLDAGFAPVQLAAALLLGPTAAAVFLPACSRSCCRRHRDWPAPVPARSVGFSHRLAIDQNDVERLVLEGARSVRKLEVQGEQQAWRSSDTPSAIHRLRPVAGVTSIWGRVTGRTLVLVNRVGDFFADFFDIRFRQDQVFSM